MRLDALTSVELVKLASVELFGEVTPDVLFLGIVAYILCPFTSLPKTINITVNSNTKNGIYERQIFKV